MSTPKPNESNGRTASGKFAPGNKGGPGNPHAKRVAEIRGQLLEAATPARMKKVINALLTQAESGDMAAIKEVFDRLIGKPTQPIEGVGDVLMPIKIVVVEGSS
jgi:hypothetical protein